MGKIISDLEITAYYSVYDVRRRQINCSETVQKYWLSRM